MKRSVAPSPTFAAAADDFAPEAAVAPRTVAEAVYQRLRQDIVWNRLPPNAPLRSDELRQAYAVGVSPLREALSRLASERMVTAVGQKGFRVAALSAEDAIDITETRILIESEALARSIARGDIAWERNVVASFHGLSRVPIPQAPGPETAAWAAHHRRFHMALIAACGSRWQLELSALLFDQAERYRAVRARLMPQPRRKRGIAAEHKELLQAALDRDAGAARKALEFHYRTTAERVLTALRHAPQVTAARRRPAT